MFTVCLCKMCKHVCVDAIHGKKKIEGEISCDKEKRQKQSKVLQKKKKNMRNERIFKSYYFSKQRILKDLKLYVEWYYLAKSCGRNA